MVNINTSICVKKDRELCRCYELQLLFSTLILTRTNFKGHPPYQIENWENGNVILKNSQDYNLDREDYKTAQFFDSAEISTLSVFDKLVIAVHTATEITESVCSKILIQQPCGSHNFELTTAVLFPSLLEDNNVYYSLKSIQLPEDCIKCEIYPYFALRTWPAKYNNGKIVPNKEFRRDYMDASYYYHGKPLCFIEFLNVRIYDRRTLLILGSKQIDYREYEIISHSSMDPGSDHGSETTYLDLTTFIEFSTNIELMEFLKSVNAIPVDSSGTMFKAKFKDVSAKGLHLFTENRVSHARW